jgi:hypothetical protein
VPDGFPAKFFHKKWLVFKEEVFKAVKIFLKIRRCN